jgi:hypothetical protein
MENLLEIIANMIAEDGNEIKDIKIEKLKKTNQRQLYELKVTIVE